MFNWGKRGIGTIIAGELYPLSVCHDMIDMYSKYFYSLVLSKNIRELWMSHNVSF